MKNRIQTILTTIRLIFRHGIPSYVLYFGESLGDNLMLTTLAAALNQHGYKKIWIKCNRDDIYAGNPMIKCVLPFDFLLSAWLLKLLGAKLVSPVYTAYDKGSDRDLIPVKHIILKMADCLGIKGALSNKPILNLDETETAQGRIFPKQIVIVTSVAGAKVPMQNKEWSIENYQRIVDCLSGNYQFIQMGIRDGLPLNNVLDMRGSTTIRKSAAILKNSLLLISHVGFMMHLARAVDCRAVIIFGGREKPWQSGYACFENISSDLPCSPCWQHNKCDFERKCMTMITPEIVLQAVTRQLNLSKGPLKADILYN